MILLRCLAQAVAERGLRLITDVLPLGNALHEIARRAWEHYLRESKIAELRGEIEKIAQATPQEIKRQAEDAVKDLPPEARQAVAGYLQQMPGVIQRTLRRPEDPTGRTMPARMSFRKADDLIAFLPERLPRFKPSDRPLAGVDWELVELLGVGGFGEVWKARNPRLPGLPPVALKFCLDATARERLMTHEAEVITQVMTRGSHPGIVALRQAYLDADPPCLEFEYVGGGDLTALIRSRHADGPPPAAKVRDVVRQLAEAVAFAHGAQPPIVHRDLKPANILTDGKQLKIADFGIGGAMAAQQIDLSTRGTMHADLLATCLRGSHTMLYASPQQVRGEDPDPRDDIHALGVIWHQMLTGDLGQGAPTGMDWIEELAARGMSQSEVKLLASCFDSNATRRPKDAGELLMRLKNLDGPARTERAQAVPPQPRLEPVIPPVPRPPERSAGPGIVLFAAFVLFLLVVGGFFFMASTDSPITMLKGTAPKTTGKEVTGPVVPISGQVFVKLQNSKDPEAMLPATRGSVFFLLATEGGNPVEARVTPQGTYSANLPATGKYRVYVDQELLQSVGVTGTAYAAYTSPNGTMESIDVDTRRNRYDITLTPRAVSRD